MMDSDIKKKLSIAEWLEEIEILQYRANYAYQ